MKAARILLLIVFAMAALVRVVDVFRPIDKANWRECDEGSIARNFVREGMNPFLPRIDWRGDGPGYAEMELPAYPYLIAVGYQIFGFHDETGRIVSLLFSLVTLIVFYRLAREYLDGLPAVLAFAFFAFNPLFVEISTSIQPEGLMLAAYVSAVFFFVRWIKTERTIDFWLAAVSTFISILAKAPSAHIGMLFGLLLLEKYGWTVVKQSRVWLFGIISVLPAMLWYAQAKSLWTTYGNSLGVSNEYHWLGPDFLTEPHFLLGILKIEVVNVWAIFGLIVAGFAVAHAAKDRLVKLALVWTTAGFGLYVLAARTTAEDWASYYHIFTVAPAALLLGAGADALKRFAKDFVETYSLQGAIEKVSRSLVGVIVISSILAAFAFEALQVRANLFAHRVPDPAYAYSKMLKPKLTRPGLIIASGGHCYDKDGYALAYNASFMFYWLDRKGWNVCREDQSIHKIGELKTRGAEYFVADRTMLKDRPGLEEQLRQAYPVIDEDRQFAVFDLAAGTPDQ